MEEPRIKVTDRRMFTEDGELREEYRSETGKASEAGPAVAGEPQREATAPSEPAESEQGAASVAAKAGPISDAGAPPVSDAAHGKREAPAMGPSEHGEPGFVDLVASLAEPIAMFLGDARLPDGESAEDLGRARYYIDLLALLRDKTSGNLNNEEDAVLGELLYRLQMRYVQKTR